MSGRTPSPSATRRLADMVEKEHALARLRIAHLDAVGEARLPVDDVALHAECREFGVRQPKERPERFGRKTCEAKCHVELLLSQARTAARDRCTNHPNLAFSEGLASGRSGLASTVTTWQGSDPQQDGCRPLADRGSVIGPQRRAGKRVPAERFDAVSRGSGRTVRPPNRWRCPANSASRRSMTVRTSPRTRSSACATIQI